MVGLTEKDLLKKASDIGLGEYHMKKERCFDMKAAWGVTSDIFIKCESSQASMRANAGRLDLAIVGGAFLQIRQRWPQILEARWLKALGRPYLRVDGLSELWSGGRTNSDAVGM